MSILDTYSFILEFIQPVCTSYSNVEFKIQAEDYPFANAATMPTCSSHERLQSVDNKTNVFPCPYTISTDSAFPQCSFYKPVLVHLATSSLTVDAAKDSSVTLDLIKYTSLTPGKGFGYLICDPNKFKIYIGFAAEHHDDVEALKVYQSFVKDFSYDKYTSKDVLNISVDEKPKNISYLNSLIGVS
jgi:hypothetical protein